MTDIVEHVRDVLEAAGLEVAEVRELPTGLGWQVRCAGGEMVCAYRTGKAVAQGKNAPMVKALLEKAGPVARAPVARTPAAAPAVRAPQRVVPVDSPAESHVSRRHPDWTEEPWDGVSVPW